MEEPVNQEEKRNPDGTFKPGISGNPAGRPKGKTLKEYAKEWFLNKSDEEKAAYIQMLEDKRPGFAWEMAEGKAKQETDVAIKELPTPILNNVLSDNSTKENSEAQ